MNEPLSMTAPASVYKQRRAKLAASLKKPLVVLAGLSRPRNYAANTFRFRAGSSYLYYGGPSLEGAAWLIEPSSDGDSGCTLYRPPSSFDDAVWMGEPVPDDAIAAAAGIRQKSVCDIGGLATAVKGRSAVAIAPLCIESFKWMTASGVASAGPDEMLPIIDQRLIKDEHELSAMRRAAAVSVQAHLAAMMETMPGRRESDVVAAINRVYDRHQCQPAFNAIVTIHGEILHSSGYPNVLESGKLLLTDAGGEEPGGYASDITRTYPVNGAFTPIQRQLYEVVLAAQRAAIAACVPGRRYRDVHDAAALVICEGLVTAGLLRGNPVELTARLAHTLFFTHGVGHLIGLDVHDMEDFGDLAGYAPGRTRRPEFGNKFLRLDRDLSAGMTVTIEPGLYFVPAIWRNEEMVGRFKDVLRRSAIDALVQARFGGIRLEDTVQVRGTESGGPEVLTGALPIEVNDVTSIVGGC